MLANDFWRSKLSIEEKSDYDALYNVLIRRDTSFANLPNLSSDRARKICLAVYSDNPQIYCAGINSIPPIYTNTDDTKFNKEVNKLCAYIATADGNYNKVLKLKDYLASSVEYDYEISLRLSRTKNSEEQVAAYREKPSNAFSAYGALVEKCAVCDGIAKAAAFILKQFGIPCIVVFGQMKNVPHSWNVVEIDGKKYHMDITNDLCIKDYFYRQTYNYFLLSDEEIQSTHKFSDDIQVTNFECDSTDSNYFAKNDLVFDDINLLRRYAFNGTYRDSLAFKYTGECSGEYIQQLLSQAAGRRCADGVHDTRVAEKLSNGQYFAAFYPVKEKPKRKIAEI